MTHKVSKGSCARSVVAAVGIERPPLVLYVGDNINTSNENNPFRGGFGSPGATYFKQEGNEIN